jgi:Fe-S-cluster containining protein
MTATDEKAAAELRRCQYECGSRCCRYITMVIPAPRRKWDFDELSWFLAHDNISVYVEAGRWHVEVQTTCKHLGRNNLCETYETRPEVCREYEVKTCEYPQRPYHRLHFDTREAFDSWRAGREALQKQRRRERAARA